MTKNPVSGGRMVEDLLPKLRTEARLSQAQLAKLAGVSRETINLIERGQTTPKPDTLRKIANGLAIDGAGVYHQELADRQYRRLMVATGHLVERNDQGDQPQDSPREPEPEPLRDRIADVIGPDKAAMAEAMLRELGTQSPRLQEDILRITQQIIGLVTGSPGSDRSLTLPSRLLSR